ncbi:MAG: beta-hydroxyacyl-ACP dehydratase [Phycisphaerales bacterium JB050]
MHFDLIDAVLEQTEDRIVTLKGVTSAEEYLQDHFPTFPVLPGVMMIEACTQAARRLAEAESTDRYTLSQVKALKYGIFVAPGDTMRIEVRLFKRGDDGSIDFKVSASVQKAGGGMGDGANCVSGRITLRPVRPGAAPN